MSTVFPGNIDTFVNPTASPPGTDKLSTTTILHSTMHTNENDAIVAIENYLGKQGSAVTGSITYQVDNLTTIVGTGAASGAPTSGTYLVLSALTGTAARLFTLGAGLSGTDAGSGSTYTLTNTVTAGAIATNGLIRHSVSPNVTIIGGSKGYCMKYVSALDKLFFTSGTASGTLFYMDRVTDTPVVIATYSSPAKTPGNFIYSSVSGYLYIDNPAAGAVFSVNASTGAVVTYPISARGDSGMAIRTSTGLIYCVSANGEFRAIDPSTDTAGSLLATLASAPAATTPFAITYADSNDSMYILRGDGKVQRWDCATATMGTAFSCFSSAASAGSIQYCASTGLVYVVSQNDSAGLKTITPGVDAVTTTYAYPAGFSNQTSSYGANMIEFGDYLYIGTGATAPATILVFKKSPAAFVTSIIADNATASYGRFIGGVYAEGVLYCSHGSTAAGNTTYKVYGR